MLKKPHPLKNIQTNHRFGGVKSIGNHFLCDLVSSIKENVLIIINNMLNFNYLEPLQNLNIDLVLLYNAHSMVNEVV